MESLLIKAVIMAEHAKENIKEKVHTFLHEEKGAAEIIAVVVLIVIVVVLAIAFKGKLADLVSSIWGTLAGKETDLSGAMDIK